MLWWMLCWSQTVLVFFVRSSSVCKMTTQIGSSGTKESNDEDKSKLSEKDKNSHLAQFLNRFSTAAIFLAPKINKEPQLDVIIIKKKNLTLDSTKRLSLVYRLVGYSVYVRGQKHAQPKSSKIFYKRNIKRPLVSINCDINTGSCRALEKSKNHSVS